MYIEIEPWNELFRVCLTKQNQRSTISLCMILNEDLDTANIRWYNPLNHPKIDQQAGLLINRYLNQ